MSSIPGASLIYCAHPGSTVHRPDVNCPPRNAHYVTEIKRCSVVIVWTSVRDQKAILSADPDVEHMIKPSKKNVQSIP